MMTGSNAPTSGRVLVAGTDIHSVKYRERDRLAIHYHQSYQVRRFRKRIPSVFLAPSPTKIPLVHLFDEPQFNLQDGYIGFMLDFFRKLRQEGRLVILCMHPTAAWHLDILAEIAEQFLFVAGGGVTRMADFRSLVAEPRFRQYLGSDMTRAADPICHISTKKETSLVYSTPQFSIGGKGRPAHSGAVIDARNPATEEVIGPVAHARQSDLD